MYSMFVESQTHSQSLRPKLINHILLNVANVSLFYCLLVLQISLSFGFNESSNDLLCYASREWVSQRITGHWRQPNDVNEDLFVKHLEINLFSLNVISIGIWFDHNFSRLKINDFWDFKSKSFEWKNKSRLKCATLLTFRLWVRILAILEFRRRTMGSESVRLRALSVEWLTNWRKINKKALKRHIFLYSQRYLWMS